MAPDLNLIYLMKTIPIVPIAIGIPQQYHVIRNGLNDY